MKYKIRDYYSIGTDQSIGISYRSFETMDGWGNHWHDCFEIELILSGEEIHRLNDKDYNFYPGELFVLTPFDCHTLIFDGPVKLVNIMLEDEYISREIYEKLLVRKTLGLENRVVMSQKRAKSVETLISILHEEYQSFISDKNEYFDAFATRMIDSILIELLAELKESEGDGFSETPMVIGKAITYIHGHYCEGITLSDVAAQMHFSSGYFSEIFKKATGQNFKSYLTNLRLKSACRMLTKSDMSVTDICFACGFESFSNFMRTFKMRYGMSPLKYRQSSKTKEMK